MSHHQINLLIHVLWSTLNQEPFFSQCSRSDLNAYITTLIKSKNGNVIISGGHNDHIHLIITLPPEISLSSLLSHIKSCSSGWLKTNNKTPSHFSWQTGYCALSTQENKLDNVASYIKAEDERHKKTSYKDELQTLLKLQNIQYDEKYFLQNSFAKIYVHAIWSTYNRTPFLHKNIRTHLYNQIHNVILTNKGVVHEIGGIEDHVHLLFELPKDKALSPLMQEVKTSATHLLKKLDPLLCRDFSWQTGYGAYSISLPTVNTLKSYIQNQESHHRQQDSQTEWQNFLISKGNLI